MPSLIKVTSLVGTAGTLIAGGYFAFRNKGVSEPIINKELTERRFKLISSLSPEEMKAQWQAEFESDSENIQKAIDADWSDPKKGGEILSNWCNTTTDLEKASKWCVIRSLKSQLERRGNRDMLSLKDEAEWDANFKALKDRFPEHIGSLENLPEDSKKQKAIELMNKWCNGKETDDYLVKNERDNFLFDNFCTKAKSFY